MSKQRHVTCNRRSPSNKENISLQNTIYIRKLDLAEAHGGDELPECGQDCLQPPTGIICSVAAIATLPPCRGLGIDKHINPYIRNFSKTLAYIQKNLLYES